MAFIPTSSNYLMAKVPKICSRAYYQPGRCVSVVKRGCERFNADILKTKKKPIITLLEELRMYMMKKIVQIKTKGMVT